VTGADQSLFAAVKEATQSAKARGRPRVRTDAFVNTNLILLC